MVSSGAIAVGRSAMGIDHKPKKLAKRQACAAIGQARLDDDLSKIVCRIQSDSSTDFDDKIYDD